MLLFSLDFLFFCNKWHPREYSDFARFGFFCAHLLDEIIIETCVRAMGICICRGLFLFFLQRFVLQKSVVPLL